MNKMFLILLVLFSSSTCYAKSPHWSLSVESHNGKKTFEGITPTESYPVPQDVLPSYLNCIIDKQEIKEFANKGSEANTYLRSLTCKDIKRGTSQALTVICIQKKMESALAQFFYAVKPDEKISTYGDGVTFNLACSLNTK